MAKDFLMPKLGHLMEEGRIAAWSVAVGDTIRKDETLLEVETEKAVLEVESPFTGKIVEILALEDEMVQVGVVIARYTEDV